MFKAACIKGSGYGAFERRLGLGREPADVDLAGDGGGDEGGAALP